MRMLPVLLAALLAVTAAIAADVAISGFVNDYAGIYSPAEIAQLNAVAQAIYDSGAAQYAIVTVPTTNGVPIETYAIGLAQGKLGDSEKDNGLLLLIAVDDRQYRFEVGSGLEGALNDAKIGRIGRDYLVPYFKEGAYGAGTIAASTAVRDVLVTGELPQTTTHTVPNWLPLILAMTIFFVIVLPALRQLRKTNKYYDAGLAASTLWNWRRGGGGGSGGFGGFGGGGFSGGGAGGGW